MRIGYGFDPQKNPFRGRDPAAVAVDLREYGFDGVFLKEHRSDWVTQLQRVGLKVYLSCGVFLARDDVWERLPGTRPLTAAGAPAPVQDWYRPALPVHPELRAMRLAEIDALVDELPVDGLWLDFIRWPARWEGRSPQLYDSSFDAITLDLFQRESGVEIPARLSTAPVRAAWILEHALEAWQDWRCEQINSFVRQAKRLLQRRRPLARLGLFMVPWTGMEVDELEMHDANLRIVGQDPVSLGDLVDVLSPMVYHRLCGRGSDWIGVVTAHMAHLSNCAVWPIVEAIAQDTGYQAGEFARAYRTASESGEGPVMVFNLEGLLADEEKLRVWRNHGRSPLAKT